MFDKHASLISFFATFLTALLLFSMATAQETAQETPLLYRKAYFIEPELQPTHTIIFLHGLGDNGHSFISPFKQMTATLKKSIRIVLPTAERIPITANGNYHMTAWFDIKRFDREFGTEEDVGNIVTTMKSVYDAIIYEAKTFYQNRTDKIFLMGFSQGSMIIQSIVSRLPFNIGGVFGCSGSVLFASRKFEYQIADAEKKIDIYTDDMKFDPFIIQTVSTPIVLYHGAQDPMVKLAWHKKSVQYLQDVIKLTHIEEKVEQGLEHSMSLIEWKAIQDFLIENAGQDGLLP